MKSKLSPILLFVFFPVLLFAQEQLTITTYYPSPSGSYRELRSQRVAIGDNYIQRKNACWNDAACPTGATIVDAGVDLVVEGHAGIGTVTPTVPLHIQGPSTGAIRIVDGNQAQGRVLVSNDTGVGTWQPMQLSFNTVQVEGTTDISVGGDGSTCVNNLCLWENMPGMVKTITTHGGGLLILFSATMGTNNDEWGGDFRILLDGASVLTSPSGFDRCYLWEIGAIDGWGSTANDSLTSFSWYEPVVPAGEHTVIIQWKSWMDNICCSGEYNAVYQKGTQSPRILILSEQ